MASTANVNIVPVLRLRPTSPALQQLIANAVREAERPVIAEPTGGDAPAPVRQTGLDARA